MDKVIEAMHHVIVTDRERILEDKFKPTHDVIKEFFNLRYDCEECDGTGKQTKHDSRGLPSFCFDCNGTGKSKKKIIGILSQNQETPPIELLIKDKASEEWIDGIKDNLILGANLMATAMLAQGWHKVQEDNNG